LNILNIEKRKAFLYTIFQFVSNFLW